MNSTCVCMVYLQPCNIREFSDRKRFPTANSMTVNPVHSGQSEAKQLYESAHNDNVSSLCKRKFCSSENVCSTLIKHVFLRN